MNSKASAITVANQAECMAKKDTVTEIAISISVNPAMKIFQKSTRLFH